jgi:hypothetical protein
MRALRLSKHGREYDIKMDAKEVWCVDSISSG